MSFKDEDTVADFPAYVPNRPVVGESIEKLGIDIGALTHCGRVRTKNEDQFVVVRRTRKGSVLASSLTAKDLNHVAQEQHAWLLAVADGLGGQSAGEVASATALRTVIDFASGMSSWIMRPGDGNLREDFVERVDLYAKAIQREMKKQSAANPALAGMATTMTAAYIFDNMALVVSVGDSRSYLIRSNEIYQITRDHTVAQEMRERGVSPDKTRPYESMVTRSFGTDGADVSVDLFQMTVGAGDQLLLCTDGLTDMLADKTILEIANTSSSAKSSCEQLVTAALDNGGRDNITVVLARF